MLAYDKPKRKNVSTPTISVRKMILSLVSGIVHYGLAVPIRWLWQQGTRFFKWTWHQTKQVFGWMWRKSGAVISWSWHTMSMIAQKTILAPFIAVGRLLGFIANPIPAGLSPQEAEAYQRINRQYRRQKRWYLHIISFLISMATLWITEFSNVYYPRVGMVVAFTVIWLIVLSGHRLWMHLGESEDREIGDALHHIRQSQQIRYFEEEVYAQEPYDTSHLEDGDYDKDEWIDEDLRERIYKTKRLSK